MKNCFKIFFILIIGSFCSCKKFLEVPPPKTQLVGDVVYSNNATASAAVTSIYSTMIGNSVGGGYYGISGLLGLSADEFNLFPTTITLLSQAYQNALNNASFIPYWNDLYNCVYQSNLAVEQLNKSSITDSIKQQLLGEVKFARAFCYFYLVNIYGDVPIVLSSFYQDNVLQLRKPATEVYSQIISDLQDAKSLLKDSYLTPDGRVASQRVRPNKGAASALLARVYLYEQKWAQAESEATGVIDNSNYQLLSNLNAVFFSR